MRDPKRIKRILDKIEKIWELRPDLRFGQFLEAHVFGHHTTRSGGCIFHFEDDDVEKALDNILKAEKNKT